MRPRILTCLRCGFRAGALRCQVDLFVLLVSRIPEYSTRLESIKIMSSFQDELDSIKTMLDVIEGGLREVGEGDSGEG